MNWMTVALALFEFALTAALAVLVVWVCYRMFIATNSDYDAEAEMKKGNLGVGFLLAALLIAAGLIVREGVYPTVNLVRLYFTSAEPYMGPVQLISLLVGQLAMVFAVAIYTMSLSLRFWGKLTSHVENGEELKRGNSSVGIVLAGVVLVVAMFISDGMSRLTKSLIPQPSLGFVQIQR